MDDPVSVHLALTDPIPQLLQCLSYAIQNLVTMVLAFNKYGTIVQTCGLKARYK